MADDQGHGYVDDDGNYFSDAESISDQTESISDDEGNQESDSDDLMSELSDDDEIDHDRGREPEEVLLEKLQSDLDRVALDAQTFIALQPRDTQLQLCDQTRALFSDYKGHGSMVRLKLGLEKFLSADDEDDAPPYMAPELQESGRRERRDKPPHYGDCFLINYTEEDDEPAYDHDEYLGTGMSNSALSDSPIHPLRVVDADSIPYVTSLPWDPIAVTFEWPRELRWPPGLLGTLNQIFSVLDYEARARFFHHVTKYGPSPVFRIGINENLQVHWSSIFQSAQDHPLGLSPETRVFLRSVFDKNPHLNHAERRMLARACRINEMSVDLFWTEMTGKTRGYFAMKTYLVARECELEREATISERAQREAASPLGVGGTPTGEP